MDDIIIFDRVTVNIVIVFGKSFDEHLRNMKVVLHDSRTGGGVDKSVFYSEYWNALSGSEEVVSTDLSKIDKITLSKWKWAWPATTGLHNTLQFYMCLAPKNRSV